MNANLIRTVVESFYTNLWNRHDQSKIPELLHEDFTFRGSLGQVRTGHADFASYVDLIHQALGEYRCDILDLVVEAPQAFARMRFSGIHQGDFFGYAPTGQRVEWTGAALFTFRAERVADLWVLGDLHGLQQLLERQAQG